MEEEDNSPVQEDGKRSPSLFLSGQRGAGGDSSGSDPAALTPGQQCQSVDGAEGTNLTLSATCWGPHPSPTACLSSAQHSALCVGLERKWLEGRSLGSQGAGLPRGLATLLHDSGPGSGFRQRHVVSYQARRGGGPTERRNRRKRGLQKQHMGGGPAAPGARLPLFCTNTRPGP